jgi:hypothetical protein
MKYVKAERLWIRESPDLSEKWVQDRIAEDPAILGLGDLILKDSERRQPNAGRLDLLLQDAESERRFEVEIQLGPTDESHIIRTIEYWDVERKRYPQYEHTAVIVAEDITSRFLNVISLFNGSIPLVAIQMNAMRVHDCVTLTFTKVLDQMTLGAVDEDEQVREVTDRGYWEERAPRTMRAADGLVEILRSIDPRLEPKYNKFYIGLAKNGVPNDFVIIQPLKSHVRVGIRLAKSEEIEKLLDESGLDLMGYYERSARYRLRLKPGEENEHKQLLENLFRTSYNESELGPSGA